MQIDVQTVGVDIAEQCRRYAEYRVFSAVCGFAGDDTAVTVGFEQSPWSPVGATYCCTATVETAHGARVEARASAQSLYCAVDRAAERLSALMELAFAAGSAGEIGRPDGAHEPAPTSLRRDTMQEQYVQVTEVDSQRLQTLIEGSLLGGVRDSGGVEQLEHCLLDADILPATHIDSDIVTMNSEVVVTDLDTGETFDFQVVFPRAANLSTGRISVLAPLGMAVLGRREGDEVTWHVPSGIRRLRLDCVPYQPERTGRDLGVGRGIPSEGTEVAAS